MRDQELAELLALQLASRPGAPNRLRLIFLAACQSATRSTADAYLGLAPRLVRAGVPAVLAMQARIGVATAQRFSAAFYRRLARHGLVDLAANEARQMVLAAGLPGAAIPVLFLRLRAGRLFEAPLAPLDERAYLNLVQEAFGHWQDLYVPQEADRLQDPRPAAAPRVGRLPHRQLEHVQEQGGMVTRTRLEVGLADWLLAQRRLALLAVPGCGKSTALEEVAWEVAQRQTTQPALDLPLPVLVPLGSYAAGEPWPAFVPRGLREALVRSLVRFGDWDQRGLSPAEADWEAGQRARRILAPLDGQLEQLRQQGRLLLLLDGLNELRGGAGKDNPLRAAVEDFVAGSVALGNRVAVACRIADYHGPLAQLPRVELLPFDDQRIREALDHYLQEDGQALWEELAQPGREKIREMLAIPLYVETLGAPGVLARDDAGRPRLPANRGAMLASFAGALLARELAMARRAGRPTVPLDVLRQALAEVAYRMRAELGSRGSVAPLADIQRLAGEALHGHPGCQPDWALALAAGAKLVDLSEQEGTFAFWKEPLQEYFAADHLLARFAGGEVDDCQGLWRVGLDPAAARRAQTGEPPRYPQTAGAWEETTILAAGLAPAYSGAGEEPRVSADAFVAAVLAVNPGLAGRCLLEGGAQVSATLRQQVLDGLAQAMVEPAYSTQVRAPCGVLLGRLGDPRFHGPEQLCLPAEPLLGFVEVPAGPFLMGSDRRTVAHWNRHARFGNPFDDELGHEPPKQTSLAGRLGQLLNKRSGLASVDIPYRYWIARYPVSNAQFQCFAEDGGYGERWQECWTGAGRRWLRGERWTEEMDLYYRVQYYDCWRQLVELHGYTTYADFLERGVRPSFERMRKDRPGEGYWADPGYNAPTQPVVGVTWHEAVAYASWLSEKLRDMPDMPPELRRLLQSGYRICLPSEAEWEKAARGGLQIPGPNGQPIPNPRPDRQWPWGAAWDPGLCNAFEGDDPVGWPSPVGMVPPGASPYGCADMAGNVWEWTRNAYRPYPFVVRPDDGAEEAEEAPLRAVRGGSWNNADHAARCAARLHFDPCSILNHLCLRVVCAPLLS